MPMLSARHLAPIALKTMQQVISLSAFSVRSHLYLNNPLDLNRLFGFGLIAAGASFVFQGK